MTEPVEKIGANPEEHGSSGFDRGPVITVGEIMETDVVAVPPSLRLEELARLITDKQISGFPVVGQDCELLGLVSQKDLVASVLTECERSPEEFYNSSYTDFKANFGLLPGGTVEDIMTPFVYFATPDTDIREVIELMLNKSIHRVVVTQRQRLVGLITNSQLLRVLHAILC